MSTHHGTDRRTALGAAAALFAGGTTALVAKPAEAATDPRTDANTDPRTDTKKGTNGLDVRESFRVVDNRGRQRWLATSRKPPAIIGGKTYPPEERQGPDDGSYFIFNDENGNEKGGIVADSGGATIAFDYANTQAITMGTQWQGKEGAAALLVAQMPDPDLPVEDVPPQPNRLRLGHGTTLGSFLVLSDSKGRPRISLEVDADDNASIKVLDADGKVVAKLPPE